MAETIRQDLSDYTKNRTKLFDLLPGVLQSDVNKAIFHNLFDRFLSASEFKRISGFIGENNPGIALERQIQEEDPHRHAFQLQPLLYQKIGKVEHLASWVDLLNELRRLGVNTDKFNEWGQTTKFNWLPPIDPNKIINFRDYFWVDIDNPSSRPQYITIRNDCNAAIAKRIFYDNLLLDNNGGVFPLLSVVPATNTLTINGEFNVLFREGFVFQVLNSGNGDLNNTFLTVQTVSYDEGLDVTTIVIEQDFTDPNNSGNISIEFYQILAKTKEDLICLGAGFSPGFGSVPFDDNQIGSIIWTDSFLPSISFNTEAEWEVVNGAPVDGSNQLWYDTLTDTLKQWSDPDLNLVYDWEIMRYNFSFLLDLITGTSSFDGSTATSGIITTPSANQWINENKWVHRLEVTNFSTAKKAQIPIIEFAPDLELNSWVIRNPLWKYRLNDSKEFSSVSQRPTLIELEDVAIDNVIGSSIRFNYTAELVDVFTPGFIFKVSNQPTTFYTVIESHISQIPQTNGAIFVLDVELDSIAGIVPITSTIEPLKTSLGDTWQGLHTHWCFTGFEETKAINHQAFNINANITVLTIFSGIGFDFMLSEFAMEASITTTGINVIALDASLANRVLANSQELRVYVNGLRTFGTYVEDTSPIVVVDPITTLNKTNDYVTGITFFADLAEFDVVRIEIGASELNELGLEDIAVRTQENDAIFSQAGLDTISLTTYSKVEQVKNQLQQNPLFDIYDINGNSLCIANPIFSFSISQDADIDINIFRRIVKPEAGNFEFEQFLISEDNGTLWCYKQFSSLKDKKYWFNPKTGLFQFLTDDIFWTGRQLTNDPLTGLPNPIYIPVIFSETEPTNILYTNQIDAIWYMPRTRRTFRRDLVFSGTWLEVTGETIISDTDPALFTVWRKGDEPLSLYTPQYVDRNRRVDGQTYIDENGDEQTVSLMIGDVEGEWEIPDPLYFNHNHENRKLLNRRELLSHFLTISRDQQPIPGYSSLPENMFHLLTTDEVNRGAGGTIKEFDNGFDILLSALFENSVTPLTVLEFAHDQYESQLNFVVEIFRQRVLSLIADTSDAAILDIGTLISNIVVDEFSKNDALNIVYGDSTAFDDVTDLGVRNWIATLPFFSLSSSCVPIILKDDRRMINELIHHDCHKDNHTLLPSEVRILSGAIVDLLDDRVPGEMLGRKSTTLPPNDLVEYNSVFSPELRKGVYWLRLLGDVVELYRLKVVGTSPIAPPTSSFPDGTLWFDSTPSLEVLKIKNGLIWEIVPGLVAGDGRFHNGTNPSDLRTATISAWELTNLNDILNQVILDVETNLYEALGDIDLNIYDFNALQNHPDYEIYLEEAFLDYAQSIENFTPFSSEEHFNAADPFTWNYKYSAPGSVFTIVGVSTLLDAFLVDGDFTTTFIPFSTFFIKNSNGNDGTWTVDSVTYNIIDDETTINVVESVIDENVIGLIYKGLLPSDQNDGSESGGDWKDLYQKTYGTPYPHLEPWKLQNYIDKPLWWDAEYKNDDPVTYGARRWKYIHNPGVLTIPYGVGMWENIRTGVIPIGQTYPNGVVSITGNPITEPPTIDAPSLPRYNYFSVNIDNVDLSSSSVFRPDDLFPPIFDYRPIFGTAPVPSDRIVRSIFFDFSTQINLSSSDYRFGDAGPVEYDWRNSSQFLYDQLTIAFRIDPANFLFQAFGFDTVNVGGIEVDRLTQNIPSHTRTHFHGEILNNEIVKSLGINQWYVNYNRFFNFDLSFSDFSRLWTEWTAPLTYQLNSMVDATSIDVSTLGIDVTNFDWDATFKRSPGVADYWLDSFNFILTRMAPPNSSLINNQSKWRFNVTSFTQFGRNIEHYDVETFQYAVDVSTNICTLYTYPIVNVNIFDGAFSLAGDRRIEFSESNVFTISGSTANDGIWTIDFIVYDPLNDETIINVTEQITDPTLDGFITANFRTLPWETSQQINLSSDGEAPLYFHVLPDLTSAGIQAKLRTDVDYFFIKLSDTQFQLALTKTDALGGSPLIMTTAGSNSQHIGNLFSRFVALNGEGTTELWKKYRVDKRRINSTAMPFTINSMQSVINFIGGYAALIEDVGFDVNGKNPIIDPDTLTATTWQTELERLITFAVKQRAINTRVSDTFNVTVDVLSDRFSFTKFMGDFSTGAAVQLLLNGDKVVDPLLHRATYYVIRDDIETFKLATTQANARNSIPIDILSDNGLGSIQIAIPKELVIFPEFEVNPFRYNFDFSPEFGVVSDIINGPVNDIRFKQLIIDQHGRPYTADKVHVFRQDKKTEVAALQSLPNDIDILEPSNTYNDLHMSGVHLLIDTYEMVLRLQNYTASDVLLYDPFIGLNVNNFAVEFNRQLEINQRPNIGGWFVDEDNTLVRNIEATTTDIRNYYDTYTVTETLETAKFSRGLLGYEGVGTLPYLETLNVSPKSQFLYWKAMIQNKGDVNTLEAFTNLKRFDKAELDEFWSFKVSEFGTLAEQEYPEIFLNTIDTRTNETRIEFLRSGELCFQPGFDEQLFGFPFDHITCEDTDIPGITIVTNPFQPCSDLVDLCAAGFDDEGFDTGEFDEVTIPDFETLCATDIISGAIELVPDETFIGISLNEEDRWYNWPDMVDILNDNIDMHFTTKTVDRIRIDRGFKGYDVPLYDATGFDETPRGYILKNTDPLGNISYTFYNDNVPSGTWEENELPIMRHNFKADSLIILTNVYSPNAEVELCDIDADPSLIDEFFHKFVSTNIEEITVAAGDIGTSELTFTFGYIPNIGAVEVWLTDAPGGSFKRLTGGVDYTEPSITLNSLFAFKLMFPQSFVVGDEGRVLKIIHGQGTLVQDVHFEIINSDVIRFLYPEFSESVFAIDMFGLQPDNTSQSPAKLIDKESRVVISQIQMFDPARGLHYHIGNHIIDLFNDEDPAFYNVSPDITKTTPLTTLPVEPYPWNNREVGTTWVDTTRVEYIPYYDTNRFSDFEDRNNLWGTLAGWGELPVYEWVESDVPPEEWDAQALIEEGNITIDESIRKSGVAKRTLFKFNNSGIRVEFNPVIEVFDLLIDNSVTPNVDGSFTLKFSEIVPDRFVISSFDALTNSFVIAGDRSAFFSTGKIVIEFSSNGVLTQNVVVSSSADSGNTNVILTNPINPVDVTTQLRVYNPFSIYNNGIELELDHVLTSAEITNTSVTISNVRGKDRIHFIQLPPSDPTVIQLGIDNGDLLNEIEHTRIKSFTNLEVEQFRYYFWVRNKKTRFDSVNKPISAFEAEQSLVNIPQPFMYFQKIVPPGSVNQSEFETITVENRLTLLTTHRVLTDDPTVTIVGGLFLPDFHRVISVELPCNIATPGGPFPLFPATDVLNAVFVGDPDVNGVRVLSPAETGGQITATAPNVVQFRILASDYDAGGELEISFQHDGIKSAPFYEELHFVADSPFISDVLTSSIFVGLDIENRADVTLHDPYSSLEGLEVTVFNLEFGVGTFFNDVPANDTFFALSVIDANRIRITLPLNWSFGPHVRFVVRRNDSGIINNSLESVLVNENIVNLPHRYVQSIFKGLRGLITDDRRYVVKFTRDYTLRDNLDAVSSDVALNSKHTEWELLREKQPELIARPKWDLITESIVGHKIDNENILLPSTERELYDARFDTDLRFGLEEDQIFLTRDIALEVVVSYLEDPSIDFTPIDIDQFLFTNRFDTNAEIISTMDAIYDRFNVEHINTIFFAALHAALSFRNEYPGVFKTSWVAAKVSIPFEVPNRVIN